MAAAFLGVLHGAAGAPVAADPRDEANAKANRGRGGRTTAALNSALALLSPERARAAARAHRQPLVSWWRSRCPHLRTLMAPLWGAGLLVDLCWACTRGVVATTGLSAGPAPHPIAHYAITELGTLGGPSSDAWGLNNLGEVVGSADGTDGRRHAYLYHAGVMEDIGARFGAASVANSINDRGQIVGWAEGSARAPSAYLYEAGQVRSLGGAGTRALAISAGGLIAGTAWFPVAPAAGGLRAYVYAGGEPRMLHVLHTLPPLAGASVSVGLDVNDTGQVVGWSGFPAGTYHACLFEDDTVRDLGTLGGATSRAVAINGAGHIVGSADTPDGASHAFLYRDGRMEDLGTLPGYPLAEASSLNASDQAAGSVDQGPPPLGRAVVWHSGSPVDLNTLIAPDSGWLLTAAHHINDGAQIVGTGILGGQEHGYLLTPASDVGG